MRRAVVTLALLLGACASSRGLEKPAVILAHIQAAESARDADDPAIERGLDSGEPLLESAALRALARIEAPGAAERVARRGRAEDPTVATWAAFALGQLGGPVAEVALADAAAHGVVPQEAIAALGRGGSPAAAATVGAYLGDARAEVRAAAALALGVLAKKHGRAVALDPRVLGALAALARDADREVRYGATYALMRLARPEAGVPLIAALADPDAEIRAQAARGLGLAGASPSVLDPVLDDADARVRVEAVRSVVFVATATKAAVAAAASRLGTLVDREAARWRDPARAAGSAHVLGELVTGALALGEAGDRALTRLDEVFASPPADAPAIEVARLRCALAFAADARAEEHTRVRTCGDTSLPAWRRLELEARLLGRQGDVPGLRVLTAHDDERVRAAAVDALSSVDTDAARAVLVELLASPDPFVASGAASALGEAFGKGYRPAEIGLRLGELLDRTAALPDPGLVAGVIDAAGALGPEAAGLSSALDRLAVDGRPAVRRRAAAALTAVEAKPRALAVAAARTEVPLASGRLRARIQTTRGDVEVMLFGDVAPRTVARVATLAAAGFFRDRTFHRVVPDFVVQGGCPRGDGWGGPGEAVLDEVSPLPFGRGALGIATSGRDTGGSQLFVMHARHPHLEGGYTLFGQVVSGLEVVDRLVQDDRILDVVVLQE